MANTRLIKSRRVEHLIRQARRQSDNEDYSSTAGISQDECVQYLNDAQSFLQKKITSNHSAEFATESYIDVVAGTEEYDLPYDMLRSGGIISVEYSDTGRADEYRPLDKAVVQDRRATISGTPYAYMRRGAKIVLINKPDKSVTNGLRIGHVKRLERLGYRLGSVSAVTLDNTTNTITSLTLSTSLLKSDGIYDDDFISIVDRDGEIKMRNIPFTAINSSTGAVTVPSDFVFEEGETITTNHYAVLGRDATTHASVDEDLEAFLIGYLDLRLKRRDESRASIEVSQEMLLLLDTYIEAYAESDEDAIDIPETGTAEGIEF